MSELSLKVFKSPLRYPGGKTRAVKILNSYVQTYFPERKTVISPFFGGGSFELFLYSNKYKVIGNDLFKPLYTFWKILISNSELLKERVEELMPITKEKFLSYRKEITELSDELEIASYYYIINRCSFSGATFCGGFSLEASTKRLNESSLKTVESYKDLKDSESLSFSNKDCIEFIKDHPENKESFLYLDPPYYISTYIYGKNGDLHENFDHIKLRDELMTRSDWILSYNDCEYIRELYKGCKIFKEQWSYGMNAKKDSSEIIIMK
jgi:DNA adenine methylase